ncbi:CPBP family intramembrane glutamic endopeptidase [Gottfriedia luciferensis]|uniref:CPBP family intramembrane glutamic endopeptidase n=1 Tax=Gottfriedia luciferensis TaxID=178774 RepID=UPI000B449295|nr:CPBP family intramembrane glutamic endopeptidase [Gottfriedia luciferensis]
MKTRDLWILLTYVIIQYSAVFGVPYLLNSNLYVGVDRKTASLEAVALWGCISFITGLIIILILLHKPIYEGFKNLSSNYRKIINWVVLGYFITMLTQIICNLILIYVFNLHQGSENTHNILKIAKLNPAFIIIPSLIAPILEEIVFRRILFKSLYKRLPFTVSAIISSVLFAFMHGDLPFFLSYFLIGFVFCYLYKRTNSILVPMLTHMLMNSFVVFQQINFSSLH